MAREHGQMDFGAVPLMHMDEVHHLPVPLVPVTPAQVRDMSGGPRMVYPRAQAPVLPTAATIQYGPRYPRQGV